MKKLIISCMSIVLNLILVYAFGITAFSEEFSQY